MKLHGQTARRSRQAQAAVEDLNAVHVHWTPIPGTFVQIESKHDLCRPSCGGQSVEHVHEVTCGAG